MKALIATKDIGGFKVAKPVADALVQSGWGISVVAEGKSFSLWQEDGYSPIFNLKRAEKINGVLEASGILYDEHPDVVIATLGSPIHIEDLFSEAAHVSDIPLVWFPDVWGAETRSSVVPNLILAFDEAERLIAQKRFTEAKIEVVGHPLMDTLTNFPISGDSYRAINDIKVKRKTVILLGGQGEYTNDMIDFILNSINLSPGAFTVIPRFHPKYKDSPHMKTWMKKLEEFSEGVIEMLDDIKADDIAALADITVSTFSTMLAIAAYRKKIPISVVTPAAKQAMVKSTGLDYYPPARVGAAIEVTAPMPLMVNELHKLIPNQDRFNAPPFDAEKAVRAITSLIKE